MSQRQRRRIGPIATLGLLCGLALGVAAHAQPTVPDKTHVNVEDDSATITLAGTPASGDGDALLTFEITVQPEKGALQGTGAQWTYRPYRGAGRIDSFEYVAIQGDKRSRAGLVILDLKPAPAPAAPAVTQPADNGGSTTEDDSKKTCVPPEFGIEWIGYKEFKVTAVADPAQIFKVRLSELTGKQVFSYLGEDITRGTVAECKPTTGMTEAVEFCIAATPEGGAAILGLKARAPILESSGMVAFSYQALSTEREASCPARKDGPPARYLKILPKHTVAFDIGAVNSLQGQGNFDTQPEVAYIGRSQWKEGFMTGLEVRYSNKASTQEEGDEESEEAEGEEGAGAAGGAAGDEAGEDEEVFDPFAPSDSGTFELDQYFMFTFPRGLPRLGLVLGAGFSTAASDTQERVNPRYYVGFRLNVEGFNHSERRDDHLENLRGNLQVDYAWDDYYEKEVIRAAIPASEGQPAVPAVIADKSERIRLTFELTIPRVGTHAMRFLIRGIANMPADFGDSASDLRLSLLASFDPRQWFPNRGD